MTTEHCIILADAPEPLTELCGISILERLLRTLQRCGLKQAFVLSNTPEAIRQELNKPSWARAGLNVIVRARAAGPVLVKDIINLWPGDIPCSLVIPADAVYDERLLQLVASHDASAALVDSAVSPETQPLVASRPATNRGKLCGPVILERIWALSQTEALQEQLCIGVNENSLAALDVASVPCYSASLRRTQQPYWFPAPSPDHAKLAKRVLLGSIQKGALDLPAIFHGPIETAIVFKLCRTSLTPNQLTILTNIVAWSATIFFATGRLGCGLVLALVVGILDGLDGKLARLKVETTPRGKLEHWFDTIFEVSWWIALAWHFQRSSELPNAFWYLLLLLGAEVIDLAAKGSVLFTYGRLIDELSRFDRAVRLLGGRRNIYVWILTIGFLLGNAPGAFALMAWWEAATALVHVVRAIFAISFRQKRAARA